MGTRQFETDRHGFLLRAEDWTEEFAVETAPRVGIGGGLTQKHWSVLAYLRQVYEDTGRCPLLYFVCRDNGLTVAQLKELFPTGYLRGLCRLAGITYREGYVSHPCRASRGEPCPAEVSDKTYRVDVRGFLVDADGWDLEFARHRAQDMQLPGGLTPDHVRVLSYLRDRYGETGRVPTIYEVCEATGLTLDELERLFPTGYHRGAVKLAGLRVR